MEVDIHISLLELTSILTSAFKLSKYQGNGYRYRHSLANLDIFLDLSLKSNLNFNIFLYLTFKLAESNHFDFGLLFSTAIHSSHLKAGSLYFD